MPIFPLPIHVKEFPPPYLAVIFHWQYNLDMDKINVMTKINFETTKYRFAKEKKSKSAELYLEPPYTSTIKSYVKINIFTKELHPRYLTGS